MSKEENNKAEKNYLREESIWSEEKLMEVLSPKTKIDLEVEKKILGLEGGFTVLFVSKSEKLPELRLSLLRKFAKKNEFKGVFVSAGLSGKKLMKQLLENKIRLDAVSIIDASGTEEASTDKVTFLDDQSDLTTLYGEIEKETDKIKNQNGFLIIDSLNTFLVYNDNKTVEKFIHSIVSKFGSKGLTIMFLAVNSRDSQNLLKTIGNFCDYFVKF